MILRKPFAILIKYFKVIHLILAAFAIYLTIKTNAILNFFSTYMADVTNVAGTDLTGTLYNSLMFWAIFIMIIGSIIIAALMAFKKKPIVFYVINILIYIYVVVIFFVSRSIVSSLEIGLVEIRTLKLVQDFITTAFLLEFVNLILLCIRATGFDIKKFDFVKDLEELEVTDIDNEEFEVSLDVDTDKINRNVRKFFRHTKYVYKENRLVFHLMFALVIGLGCYFTYSKLIVNRRTFQESVAFSTDNFVMDVLNTTVVKEDYRGNTLKEGTSFVVVQMNIQSYVQGRKFEPAKLHLTVKDHHFYHTTDYQELLFDLGTIYNNQFISTKFTPYLFVFEIPTGFADEEMKLTYIDDIIDRYNVILSPKNFGDVQMHSYKLGDVLNTKDSVLGEFQWKMEGIDLNTTFEVGYPFCTTPTSCITSYELLQPSYTDRYDKALLVVDGLFQKGESSNDKVQTLFDLIRNFGTIDYELNGQKKQFIPIKKVDPTKTKLRAGNLYLEVNRELMQAEHITLTLKIRNQWYQYVVK